MKVEYTMGFPPEMNDKKYRKSIDEKEDFMTIPLEGQWKKREKKKDDRTH